MIEIENLGIVFGSGKSQIAAVKNVTSSEDPFGEHFPGQPVMPGSLIIEGMAQTAGILVGHTGQFAEKVILAKVSDATLQADARPGDTLLYEAELKSFDTVGASTAGSRQKADAAKNAARQGWTA